MKLNLRKFDGAVAPAATTVTPTGESTPSAAGKGKGEQVVYGKQPEDPSATVDVEPQAASENPSTITTSDTLEARKADFEKLIQGDYKDLFTERIQGVIDKRFKEAKTLEKQFADLQPVMDILSLKYGEKDLAKLAKAVEEDVALYEDEALKRGMSVEQLRRMQKLERENEMYQQRQREEDGRRRAEEDFKRWEQQSDAMKELYPKFNLMAEMQNPSFMKLLTSGVDIKTAYQAVHMDEVLGGAMNVTAQKVREATVNDIKSKAARPTEAGISTTPGVIVKNDVSKLTPADRKDIARRVARGERIEF